MSNRLLKPGDSLGKYELVEELAIGGMASIYLARVRGTAGFEKTVVLKCILPSLAADRGFVTMFLDEARLAATLRHSNIADVFDVGAEGTHYYFAMEHIHGRNAREVRLQARRGGVEIPLEFTLATILGTAAALAYAHDREGPEGPLEIVHRDVSPSNILVSYEGAVKLVDFGIARVRSGSAAKTRTNMRKGKVPYMSPEQCQGQAVDRRSDLFSLGTVLYELTTPQRPFVGETDFEVMDAIVTRTPPAPSRLVPGYPPLLEQIVMRLLARSPDARYPTAHELIEDLERFRAESGILTSAHVVARFMRDLFTDDALDDVDTVTLRPRAPAPVVEPPAVPSLKIHIRPPRTAPSHRDDAPAGFAAEPTRQDVVPAFDPIAARSAEMIAELDNGAPANETDDARASRRVDTLIHQAMAWLALGEADKAVTAVEHALDEGATSPDAQALLQTHVETLVAVYEGMLEDPYRTPRLTRAVIDLVGVPLEERARLLLPFIDGTATIRDIIDRSGMPRLEVYHHLCHLLLRGLVQ